MLAGGPPNFTNGPNVLVLVSNMHGMEDTNLMIHHAVHVIIVCS
jgi:hypothetical protein